MAEEDDPVQAPDTRRRDRSPSFPFIPLATAVDRLVAFEQKFGRHPAPAHKVGLAWGMKEKSSQAFQTLAALVSYGLLRDEGSAAARFAHVSEEGRTYLRAQQTAIKAEILKKAALKPRMIAKFWSEWGADRPPDEICLDKLILEHKFTDSAARTFLKVYDETIGFAGLTNSDMVDVGEEGDASDEDDPREEDDPIPERPQSPERRKAKPGMNEDTFTLKEGTVVLQWPEQLSEESYEDLEAWAQLILRKVKRHVVREDDEKDA